MKKQKRILISKGPLKQLKVSFPKTEVRLCVVHQIRNSLKYIGSKDQKTFMRT